MGLNEAPLFTPLEKAELERILKAMQEEVRYTTADIKQNSLLRLATQRIPWLSRFWFMIDELGEVVIKAGEDLSELRDTPGNDGLSNAFHFGGVAMAALDFIRVPVIYLAAFLLKEKVPVTLDNNARLLYSAILLGLTITAIAVPVTAPIIAFITAGSGLAVATFLLVRVLYERYQLGRERKKVRNSLIHEEDEMLKIQKQANFLEQQLSVATESDHFIAIVQEVVQLQERYKSQKNLIQDLKHKEQYLDQRIGRLGTMRVMDKSMALIFASLTVVGLVLSLFFPPVGMWFLGGVAIAGGVYLIGRIASPFIISIGQGFMKKDTSPAATLDDTVPTEHPFLDNGLHESDSVTYDTANSFEKASACQHESTSDVLIGLLGREKAISVLSHAKAELDTADSARVFSLGSSSTPTHHAKQAEQNTGDEGDIDSEGERPEP